MPINPNALAVIGIVASFSAVIAALVSGIFVVVNGHITNKKTKEIEQLKSELSGEIERLKAQLGHGQVVSTTQWNAEFGAYQALWKSMVPLRTIAMKIISRESDLAEFGLVQGDVSESDKIKNKELLLARFARAISDNTHAVNDNAPFYLADIRNASNGAHVFAHVIFKTHVSALVAQKKGQTSTPAQAELFELQSRKEIVPLMEKIDCVEEMIRNRLNAVRIMN
jgi:hypothetical protein